MARKQSAPSEIPIWEWIVAGLGLLLLTSTIGVLLYEAASRDDSPPDVVLEAAAPLKTTNGYLITVRAINRGGNTAAKLTVAGELRDRTLQTIETAEIEFDYLAGYSEASGGFIFKNDPSGFELKLIPKSYVSP